MADSPVGLFSSDILFDGFSSMTLFVLSDKISFPPPHLAEPDGLLAVGGDLSVDRLILAYQMGIFPWYSEGDPVLWWSPDPRLVLFPEEIHVSRRLKRTIEKGTLRVTFDAAFGQVVSHCAEARSAGGGTWILPEMMDAYIRLHRLGIAHSVEAWDGETLAGGLYGVCLGKCFFGESMFTRIPDASKVAFVTLAQRLKQFEFAFIDCQVTTGHLLRMGAREIPRKGFLALLKKSVSLETPKGTWENPSGFQ